MKPLTTLFLLLLLPALLLNGKASATQIQPGTYFGSTLIIHDGETVHGDLLLVGGRLTIEKGGLLDGNLLTYGAQVELDGVLRGDALLFGGHLSIGKDGLLDGDLLTFITQGELDGVVRGDVLLSGGEIRLGSTSQIQGELILNSTWRLPAEAALSSSARLKEFAAFQKGLFLFGQALLLGLLALLAALFLENPLLRTAQAFTREPLIAGGLGLLTFLVAPLILLVLIITLVLIPVALLGLLLLGLALLFGWLALGIEIGQRLSLLFHRQWSPPWSAALGTFLLTLLTLALNQIPCLGWMVGFLALSLGLGATLMTSFGTRSGPLSGLTLARREPTEENPLTS